jgi:hypothetical protein
LTSLAAICAGFGYVYVQRRWQDEEKRRDREERAEIVALRLSGWLSEVGSRITVKSEAYDSLVRDGKLPQPHQIVQEWKLEVISGVEDAMPDLHYLRAGSGDVAQLAFLVRYFDTFLEQARVKSSARMTTGNPTPYGERELEEMYNNVRQQLELMRGLHASADLHLAPFVGRTVARER